MCVLRRFSNVRLFETLCTIAHQSPLSWGFSRQEDWSGLLCPPPQDLPDPGIESTSPASLLHWQVDSLPLSHQGIQSDLHCLTIPAASRRTHTGTFLIRFYLKVGNQSWACFFQCVSVSSSVTHSVIALTP